MPTIKLGLDPLRETEFGVIMLFLGILRMGVVTWSVNMHKDTVIYFCWHWPWTWRFLKSHRLQFQLTTAAQGWGHCSYMRTISTLCWYLWATLQAKKPFREEKGGGGYNTHCLWYLRGSVSPRGQHYCREEQWENTCSLLLILGSSKDHAASLQKE